MTPDEISRLGRTLDKIDGKVDDIGQRVAKIEQRVDDLTLPGDGAYCLLHRERLDVVEGAARKIADKQDKQNLVAMVLSAATAAVVLAAKWLLE